MNMRIVAFGDSLTACGGEDGRFGDILADRFPDHQFIIEGFPGETLAHARGRVQTCVLDHQPDILLLEFGANDWWQARRPPTSWAKDLETIVRLARADEIQVVLLGLFGHSQDERACEFRKLSDGIAERYSCLSIPDIQVAIRGDRNSWGDPNHPNEYGNRHVADAIQPVLEKLLSSHALSLRTPQLNSLRDLLHEAAALAADKPAILADEHTLSWSQLADSVTRLATAFQQRSGSARPRVAVFLPNCLEYALIYWAVADAGGVIVPLNTFFREDALAAIFASVVPDILIAGSAKDRAVLTVAESADCPSCCIDSEDWQGMLSTPPDLQREAIHADDDAIIMHTSGTTSVPKAAVMRHSDLRFNAMATINAHSFSPSDVHLIVNPMFHCTALYSSLPTAAYQKSPIVITADTTPGGLLALVARHRISTFLSVPTICQRVVELPELANFDTSSLRIMAYAGSPMPPNVVCELRKRLPQVTLHNFFGLTETISMSHVLRTREADARPDSIGRLLPFVEAEIVDDDLHALPVGETGELLFARENVISRYHNAPELLDAAIVERDGRQWFRSGDLACVDTEGFFFIKGRKKDMIIVGGENVYAAEVEAVIAELPGVHEAAVIAVPATGSRSVLGELIHAFVVSEGLVERDVRRHCHQRLASYKIPHIVSFIASLPRNPSGKVLKNTLKEMV
ncbi:MAG: acyl-CoA synthetase (AMP-forming)/AMP-acid ligase II/lysophospholipase L1-like esterase [Rhodothermales bacterium]|jgi:acyl-CoA synthetase (AMP-forming)/AMP-acid ligase II/lysophospholipase L1-like esterase